MATTTPRIGLTKPDGTDLVDIAVLNTNFDKIDSNIASTKIQSTKPTTANAGDLWWDSDTGTLYLYYTDANSSQWVAATSDPINIGVVANQTERDAQYPTPAQGMSVYRTDLGVTQRYYGLFNSSTNPGGMDSAGWYSNERSGGLVQLAPTVITPVTGTATVTAMGTVSFSGCTSISLDGLFSARFKNYKLVFTDTAASNTTNVAIRMKQTSGGTSTSGYYSSGIYTTSTTTGPTGGNNIGHWVVATVPAAGTISVCSGEIRVNSPYLARETTYTSHLSGNAAGPELLIMGGFHGNTALFDGITLLPLAGTLSGEIAIYGLTY